MFRDRLHAAQLIAAALSRFSRKNALVLAIPRGGVPMAKVIADEIKGELDVVLVHKLGHPGNMEYAIGAIDEEGNAYFDPNIKNDSEMLRSVAAIEKQQLKRLKNLRAQYTPLKKRIDPSNRIVIIVDDGIATGWTAKAAISLLKRAKAKYIIVATAVGPLGTIKEIEALADEVVCLETPTPFHSVGQFYKDFSQVTDEDVAQILQSS